MVLGGGGARGAYQVGVLHAIAARYPTLQVPILVGVSAGAVNATHLAAHRGTFADAMQALVQAESALGGTLGRLFALSEAYPELKSDQNMLGLQEELGSTENRIAFARQAFNDEVTDYNTRREVFPKRLLTGLFGFEAANLMAATESADERQPAKVSF